MSQITILLPHGEIDAADTSRAARLPALGGRRIGFLDNGLWRSMRILADELAEQLVQGHGIAGSVVVESGPMHGAQPREYREQLESLAARVDAVVSGLGN